MNIHSLVEKYGSPLYIYDISSVRISHGILKNALPADTVLYYSLKANPHPYIVKELVKLGCRCEVSSINELLTALAAGAVPDEVLYTGPAKSAGELALAVQYGVRLFSCESWNEILKLLSIVEPLKEKVRVVVRINPDVKYHRSSLSMTGVSSPFGIDEEQFLSGPLEWLDHPLLDFAGFHVFNGTNFRDVESILRSMTYSIKMAKRMSSLINKEIKFLDLGGGFGHPFAQFSSGIDLSPLRELLTGELDREFPGWRNHHPKIAFESGRFLVGPCGKYVSRVEDLKTSKGRHYIVLDGGIHHLGGMSGIGRMQTLDVDFTIVKSDEDRREDFEATIVGPLCTPLDIIKRKSRIPRPQIRDLIVIPNVGAYGLTASLIGFLSRDMPTEVVFENDKVLHVSRLSIRREVLDDSRAP